MTALDFLRADHRQILQLLEQVRQTQDFAERHELFEEIRDKLELHSEMEEEVFYPRFSRVARLEELMSESAEDHQLMREIIDETASAYDSDDFNELLEELVDTVEDHISEEESEVFPRLIDALDAAQWDELSHQLLDWRDQSPLAA